MVDSSELRSPINRPAAGIDLAIAVAFFVVCYAVEPVLDPLLRHGSGLLMVFALATYQFMFEGLALLFIMRIRHEHLSDYGFVWHKRRQISCVGLGIGGNLRSCHVVAR